MTKEEFQRIKKGFRRALEKNIFYRTKDIHIELSNLCNYTLIHPQCPTSRMKKHHIMTLEEIEDIAKRLGALGYDRILSPYTYSEPSIDPRLYTVLEIFTKYVPKATIAIVSNGFFLYETVLEDIIKRGMKRISITCYFPNEHERIKKLVLKIKERHPEIFFRIIKGYPLRKRMCDKYSIYDTSIPPNDGFVRACRAPYRYVYITRYCDIGLCCNDWKFDVKFGSLKEKSFKEIFLSDKMMDMHLNLSMANRKPYPLCSRCYRSK